MLHIQFTLKPVYLCHELRQFLGFIFANSRHIDGHHSLPIHRRHVDDSRLPAFFGRTCRKSNYSRHQMQYLKLRSWKINGIIIKSRWVIYRITTKITRCHRAASACIGMWIFHPFNKNYKIGLMKAHAFLIIKAEINAQIQGIWVKISFKNLICLQIFRNVGKKDRNIGCNFLRVCKLCAQPTARGW